MIVRLPPCAADLVLDFAGQAMWRGGAPFSRTFARRYRQRQACCARAYQEDLAIFRFKLLLSCYKQNNNKIHVLNKS
mgnify:CR=1 FL=1